VNAGFFGKMPGHGDFVERGLPAAFKDGWDGWLQHGIAASKAAIGDTWLDAYLTSPVWRFALSPGVAGETGWVGVLVPSVDRVGRHFPLTIAASVEAEVIPLQMMVAAAAWHDGAQDAALGALHDDQVDADVLVQRLQLLGDSVFGQPPIYCSQPVRDPREAMHAHALRMPFSYGTTPGHGLLAFSHRMIETLFGQQYSLWWTHGSERVEPGMFACAQLPSAEAFAGMLTDQVIAPGWISLQGYEMPDAAIEQPAPPSPAPVPSAGPVEPSEPVEPAEPVENYDTPGEAAVETSGLIPEDFDDGEITLVPGVGQESLPVAEEQTTGSEAPAGGLAESSTTAFDDLIVDASAEGFEADRDPPVAADPVADGPQPVQVSSDDILAGFGEPEEEPVDNQALAEPDQIEEPSDSLPADDGNTERAGDVKP
jgi:type VI secretion system protein ImpM